MTKLFRIAAVTTPVVAIALIATSANAVPVTIGGPALGHANIVKPLTLKKDRDLDFGTITVLDAGLAKIDAAGAVTCNGGLSCSGTATTALFTVTGTNNQVVTITKPASVTLTNSANPGTDLSMTLIGQDTVTLTNAGAPGTQFPLGGQMNVPANVKEGTYQGDLNVTVNYQ